MRRLTPNLITLGNLLCGAVAAFLAARGDIAHAGLLICLGIFLDFFDGLTARLLHVVSPVGKELDSLADVVTSGVAPAFILHNILADGLADAGSWGTYIPLTAWLMPLFAAYRLAKFNLDTRQSHSFRGLPVPANALLWVGLALTMSSGGLEAGTVFFIMAAALSLFTDFLMISELPMFSLKFDFKDLSWSSNAIAYCFLAGCVAIISATRQWYSISAIIVWYILLSLLTRKKSHAQ